MPTYLQYVRRDLEIGAIDEDEALAWSGPVGLGTDQPLFGDRLPRPGDRIYLVSVLGGLAAVDALVVVTDDQPLHPKRLEALAEAKTRVFAAGPGSRWFPMLDAEELLERLVARLGHEGETSPVLGKTHDIHGNRRSVAQRLLSARSLRRLTPSSADEIATWARTRLDRPVFVSYRSRDGAGIAATVAAHLARSGIPVWYDLWSISIRLDELDRDNARAQLDEHIHRAIADCCAVVRIETPEYGESEWTAKESRWSRGRPIVEVSAADPELDALVGRVRALRAR